MFYIIIVLTLISINMASAQYTKDDFAKLYKLEGKWSMNLNDNVLYEVWLRANDTLLEGESYTIEGGAKEPMESLKLSFDDGDIFYTPTVFNQNEGKPVPFKLVEIKESVFTFENKEHDFPQRIIYNLKSEDEVDAAIEGNTGTGFKRIEFPYKKDY